MGAGLYDPAFANARAAIRRSRAFLASQGLVTVAGITISGWKPSAIDLDRDREVTIARTIDPDEKIYGEGLRDGQDAKPDREQDSAGGEHRATAMVLDRSGFHCCGLP
jgi:hypothetical protein